MPEVADGTYHLWAIGAKYGDQATAVVQVVPTIKASYAQGPFTTRVTVLGSGFAPYERATIAWDNAGNVVAQANANASGVLGDVAFNVPSGSGTHTIYAAGADASATAVVPVSFGTYLLASPPMAYPTGDTFITATGLPTDTGVTFFLGGSTKYPLGSGTSDGTGTIADLQLTIPTTATLGTTTIVARRTYKLAALAPGAAPFEVVPSSSGGGKGDRTRRAGHQHPGHHLHGERSGLQRGRGR